MEADGSLKSDQRVIETIGSNCRYQRLYTDIIGQGGFGVVYEGVITERGDYTGDSNNVAVKAVHLDSSSEIVRNKAYWTKTLAKLRELPQLVHPHLVRYHQICLTKAARGIRMEMMMERCSGDLASLLKEVQESGERDVNQYKVVGQYCKDITTGVDFLHRQAIIHGDLKPGNVLVKDLLEGKKMLVIGDLDDLVRLQENMTCSGDISQLRGTLHYMSPEMLRKFSQCETESPGRRTDIWSLGCILLEIAESFFGKKIVEKRLTNTEKQISLGSNVSKSQFAAFIMDGYVPVVDDKIPRKLAACIKLCLQPNPNGRLSAAALLHKISVFGATGFVSKNAALGVVTGNVSLGVVIMDWSSISSVIKVMTLDSATNRIQIFGVSVRWKMELCFPQLTLLTGELIFRGVDERLHLWKPWDGTWRSFRLKSGTEPADCRNPVVLQNMLYYFNRFGETFLAEKIVWNNTTQSYETTMQHVRPSPLRKGWAGGVYAVGELGGKILYAYSEWTTGNENEHSGLILYDPIADEWKLLAKLPHRRDWFDMAVVGEYIYILGGCFVIPGKRLGITTSHCMRFSMRTATWEDIYPLQHPRSHLSTCAANERIYVCGGNNAEGENECSIEFYDTSRNEPWSIVALSEHDEELLQHTICGH
ncbi:uncharacterized protein LOC129598149 [Paramacrobiotus metropolitanus]|uniref:uncharacterized protein LOC129598149 n=1 Tax=Paramacrobiotus metropolitanus TaxID=2943436 RepID=UPI002445C266|nr:uncharacterized protein LOC129598149 [Paramacrobiotus metropolitanus]